MTAEKLSFGDFWSRFQAAEKRAGAFDLIISGVQIYPMLRVKIFYALAQALGIYDDPHPASEKPAESVGKAIPAMDTLKPAPVIVIPFNRLVAGAEPYSDRIVELLEGAGIEPRTIKYLDPAADLDIARLRESFVARFETQANELLAVQHKFRKSLNRAESKKRWADLIATLEGEFGVKLPNFEPYPYWLLRHSIIDELGFKDFFGRLKTKDLYIVNAYTDPRLVRAARMAGVKVHDIQHGFVSKQHPAYSFLPGTVVQSSSDELLTWGEYWNTAGSFPKGMTARTTGPTKAMMEYRALALAENRIRPNQVLFTSQGAIGRELFEAAFATAKSQPNLEVIFRLHPNESLEGFEKQAMDLAAGEPLPSNLSISHRVPIFLDLVSRSEYLVGAFSTTLFEGLSLGCKVLVLPLPGFENTLPAIQSGDITLVTDLSQLPKFLAAAKPAADPSRYYSNVSKL